MKGTKTSRMVWSVMAAVALLAVATGPARAQEWGHRGGGWDGGGVSLGVPLRSLNLTSDQQAQVKTILSNYHATARSVGSQLRQAQSTLTDTMLASPAADVSAQLATINGLRSQLLQASAQATAQVLGVLTPAQLSQAASMRSQMIQLRAQMRQLMMPPSSSATTNSTK